MLGTIEFGTAAQWAQACVAVLAVTLSILALCHSRRSARKQRHFQQDLQREQQAFETRLRDDQRAREDAKVNFILRKRDDGRDLLGITLLIAKYGSMPLTVLHVGARLGDKKQFFNHPSVNDATPHALCAGDVWSLDLPVEALQTVKAFNVVQDGTIFIIKDCFGTEYESRPFSLLPPRT
jgi:hypothetical protein